MGALLDGSAGPPAAVRRAIPPRPESLAPRAARNDRKPQTSANGQNRAPVPEAPMGPTPPPSPRLTKAAAALIVTFRRPPRLPWADGLDAGHAPFSP